MYCKRNKKNVSEQQDKRYLIITTCIKDNFDYLPPGIFDYRYL